MSFFSKKDFQDWPQRFRANFFNSLGGYKSINLMGSQSKEGLYNLAPFFSVQHIGANPPLLSLIFRPETVDRHSLDNFRSTGFATLNAVHPQIAKQAHQASAKYPAGISEFEMVGLEPDVKEFCAPYVKEANLQIGLSWSYEHTIPLNGTILVIAAVEEVFLNKSEALFEDGFIDHHLLETLTVNGLENYYQPQPYKRFPYARPNLELKEKRWTGEM